MLKQNTHGSCYNDITRSIIIIRTITRNSDVTDKSCDTSVQNAMAWLPKNAPLRICVTMPNLVVLTLTVYA